MNDSDYFIIFGTWLDATRRVIIFFSEVICEIDY